MNYKLYTIDNQFIEEVAYVNPKFTGIVVHPGNVGIKEYLVNGKNHRTDGPSVIWSDGTKFWCINDKNHRFDGPAIEWADGKRFYYIYGKRVTKEQHALLVDIMNLKGLA